MKEKIRTIWNSEINLDDWKDFIEEEYPDYTDESFLYERCSNMNDIYLEDEKMNLNKELKNPIICIADLGLWNGRKSGYKILGNNLNEIFNIGDFDDAHWYVTKYNIKCSEKHHDGINHYLFRELKDIKFLDLLCQKCIDDMLTPQDIALYTRSLKPYVSKIYGWEENENIMIEKLKEKWYKDCLKYNIPVSPSDIEDIIEDLLKTKQSKQEQYNKK